VAEEQGEFVNQDEDKLSPLEAVTRGLVKTELTEKMKFVP
jgi:hypothetical protein